MADGLRVQLYRTTYRTYYDRIVEVYADLDDAPEPVRIVLPSAINVSTEIARKIAAALIEAADWAEKDHDWAEKSK